MALNDEMVGGAIDWAEVKKISKPYLKKGLQWVLMLDYPLFLKRLVNH